MKSCLRLCFQACPKILGMLNLIIAVNILVFRMKVELLSQKAIFRRLFQPGFAMH